MYITQVCSLSPMSQGHLPTSQNLKLMKSPIQDEILVGAQEAGYREASRLLSSQPILSGCPLSFPLPSYCLPLYFIRELDWQEPKRNWGRVTFWWLETRCGRAGSPGHRQVPVQLSCSLNAPVCLGARPGGSNNNKINNNNQGY